MITLIDEIRTEHGLCTLFSYLENLFLKKILFLFILNVTIVNLKKIIIV